MADDIFSQGGADWHADARRATIRRVAAGGAIGIVAIAAAIGGWQYRSYRTAQADMAASARYFDATHVIQSAHVTAATPVAPEVATAAATLADLQAHGPEAMRGYAGLQLASLRSQEGDVAGARKAWEAIAADDALPAGQRDLASLMSLEASPPDAAGVRAGFERLSRAPGPFRTLAQEQIVGLDLGPAASATQAAEARRLLAELVQNASAPDGVRQRAQMMLQTLGDTTPGQVTGGAG